MASAASRPPTVPLGTSENLSNDLIFTYQWLLETRLVWIRWLVVPLCLMLIPLYPTVSPLLIVLHALGLALGNVSLAWLLRQGPHARRLRVTRELATGLEWLIGLGVVLLCSQDPTSNAPAVLTFLLLVDGARYGMTGLLRATVGAWLGIMGMVATQALIFEALPRDRVWLTLARWEILLLAAALVVGGLLRAIEAWRRQEEARWESGQVAFQWLQSGLSRREWELLPLLAREELTYEQIAEHLSISPETVKTHIHRLGEKLGATGRRAIVATARRRGLLLPLDDSQRS